MVSKIVKNFMTVLVLLSAAACSSNQAPSGLGQGSDPIVANSVFFALNNSQIPPYYIKLLTLNAGYLIAHSDAKIQLQGNSSEVGTSEHNKSLALMRAQSVKQALLKMGVNLKQITVLSYGNSKPAFGNEADGFQPKNQRVDIIYTANPPTQYSMKLVPMINTTTMY
jgi:peptidoglycan-associated lipoprotein